MRKNLFTGVATAIVTPFDKNLEIDYFSFGKLIDMQLNNNITTIVVCGSTGEASTLSYEERKSIISFAISRCGGKAKIIAGVGSNNYENTLKMIDDAAEINVDGLLIVTPYYNKTTQNGLVKLYKKYAYKSIKPIIIYNVPSRTGVNFLPETYYRLKNVKNIVGIKEASCDISQMAKTISLLHRTPIVYSGNDDLFLPSLSIGAKGIISVASNIIPKTMIEMYDLFSCGKVGKAIEIQKRINPFISSLFCEVNPIPIKFALSKMGIIKNYLRLPLNRLDKKYIPKIELEMEKIQKYL